MALKSRCSGNTDSSARSAHCDAHAQSVSLVFGAEVNSDRPGKLTLRRSINALIVPNILRTPGFVPEFSSSASIQTVNSLAASDCEPRCAAIRTWIVAATKVV